MFAITIKFHGTTNTKGSRLIATGGSVTKTTVEINGDDTETVEKEVLKNHLEKFTSLNAEERDIENWYSGWVGNDTVFVFVPKAG